MEETIYNDNQLFKMLDSLLREPTQFWDSFYGDRNKKIPFFNNYPDENLVEYFQRNLFCSGNKVLELGCGPGRNAIYIAKQGCQVDAVDISLETITWAKERAKDEGVQINFIHQNIFDLIVEDNSYDMIYDSGCFHHIAPHRRLSYVQLVKKALKPNGFFAMTCFLEGGKYGGATISDWEVYKLKSMQGGLGYTDEKLRHIFNEFKEIEIRPMNIVEEKAQMLGLEGFLTCILQK